MSNFVSQESDIVEQAIDETSTTQKHPLGKTIRALDVASTDYGYGEFIYLKGLDSTAVGECILYAENNYQSVLAVADGAGSVCFSMSICVTGEFGWYQIKGRAVSLVLAGYAAAANYLTATPGSLDDAIVAGDRVHRCLGTTNIDTPATGQAEMRINYPYVNNIAD
jgi:hypothetical protein